MHDPDRLTHICLEHHRIEAELLKGGLYLSLGEHVEAGKIFDAKAGRPSAIEEKKAAELQRLKDVVVEITTENLELKKGLSD